MGFDGFSADTFNFFHEIQGNNEKVWFDANKPRFKAEVQAPAQALVTALGDRLAATELPGIVYDTKLTGAGSIMRIYRDTRFSKDKTPYKTNLGMVWWEGPHKRKMENPSFYLHLDANGIWMAGGFYQFTKEFMALYRDAVIEPKKAATLHEAMAAVEANGLRLGGDMYARVPRGYEKDHPEADLLKRKGLMAQSGLFAAEITTSADLVDAAFGFCMQCLPLHRWLVDVINQK